MKFFKYIGYALKAKKGIQHTDELIADISFGPLEAIFTLSFILLGILTFGLGFVAFYYLSKVALFFAIMFLCTLAIDIWIFMKVKNFFAKISKKAMKYSKNQYKSFNNSFIVDVKHE